MPNNEIKKARKIGTNKIETNDCVCSNADDGTSNDKLINCLAAPKQARPPKITKNEMTDLPNFDSVNLIKLGTIKFAKPYKEVTKGIAKA